MKCACHGHDMYWNKSGRYKRGGFWSCSTKRQERNARRVRVFGSRLYMDDLDIKQFAVRLREQRREAQRGRTEI